MGCFFFVARSGEMTQAMVCPLLTGTITAEDGKGEGQEIYNGFGFDQRLHQLPELEPEYDLRITAHLQSTALMTPAISSSAVPAISTIK